MEKETIHLVDFLRLMELDKTDDEAYQIFNDTKDSSVSELLTGPLLGGMKFDEQAELPFSENDIIEVFYELENNDDHPLKKQGLPFKYIEAHEQRGDGSGYETNFVFQRQSDGKYFAYYIYDGRFEHYELREVKQIVKTTWDFECTY